jgi:two-component system heavy metal sensor histidine kinase CusS
VVGLSRSITWRLTAMFAAAALVTFTLIGSALFFVLRSEMRWHVRQQLDTYMQDMQYLIEHVTRADRWNRAQTKMDALTPADGSVRFWVLSDDARFLYGRDLPDLGLIEPRADGTGRLTLPGRSYALHVLERRIPGADERPGVRLVIGISGKAYAHTMRTLIVAMVSFSLTATLLIMMLGYWIARVGLWPLKQLSNEAKALSPRTPSQRLRAAPLPHELSDLAGAFNGALGRLEGAYQQLEAFNADVAHELRTPLANLIGVTQVALSRQRSAPEFEDVLQSNLEELERMRGVVNDMLFLARADQGEAATGLELARVADEAAKTIEFFEFVLDERRIAVSIEGDAAAAAPINQSLIRRAMTNLLQNAIDHSPDGAAIVIRVRPSDEALQVEVSNPGEPIPPDHLPRLFDRFYRVDPSRHDAGQQHGHGLGLAIVKAVAGMHGGEVFAASSGGRTTIGFSLRRPIGA